MWSRRPLRLAEAQPIGADCVSWITCLEIFLPGCRPNGSDAEPFSGFRLTVSSWAILVAATAQKARRWLSQIREPEKSVIREVADGGSGIIKRRICARKPADRRLADPRRNSVHTRADLRWL